MQNSDLVQRLKSIEGHVRGVEKMVGDGVYCIDVLRQIQAVHAALNKVSTLILDNHLNTCVVTAIRSEDPAERERVLSEIAEIYEAAKKV
ncbi:MAG TPA: metal-sensitive transcriptional regulator [Anaerolineaceae bacterium]|jgi:CsoR family transcriptional regulator, copper-sensing transcriptional repressor